MRRILALLLAFTLCLGMLPAYGWAEEAPGEVTEAASFEEAEETEESLPVEEAEEAEPVLVITMQPEDTLAVDGAAYFAVAAQVTRGEEEALLAYQWQQLVDGGWTDLAGQTEDSLVAEDPETGDTFRCVVSWEGLTAVSEAVRVLEAEAAPQAEQPLEIVSDVWVNPEYRDLYSEEDVSHSDHFASDETTVACRSEEEVLSVLREALVARKTSVAVTYDYAVSDGKAYAAELTARMFDHTGNPKEGDYLYYSTGSYDWSYSPSGGYFALTDVDYYTTAAQEAQADAAVRSILDSLNLTGKTQKQKTDAIYTYLTTHVKYVSKAELNDKTNVVKYSGYAALVQNNAVCQGYAGAFYRLCLESGIDSRVISCHNMNHAWNIVGLGGQYYYLDATWDANTPKNPRYYLKGTANWLKNHKNVNTYNISELGDQYTNSKTGADFTAKYPVPEGDYEEPAPLTIHMTIVDGDKSSLMEVTLGTPYFSYQNKFASWAGGSGRTLEAMKIRKDDGTTRLVYKTTEGEEANVQAGDTEIELVWAVKTTTIQFYAKAGDSQPMCTLIYRSGDTLENLPKLNGKDVAWYTEAGELLEAGKIYNFSATSVKAYPKAQPEVVTGTCGRIQAWSLNRTSGILNIWGSDVMWEFAEIGATPWGEFSKEILGVVIEEGVETIGSMAFKGCKNLKTIEIPGSLTVFGDHAFDDCTGLTDAYYKGNRVQWKGIWDYQQLDGVTLHPSEYVVTYKNVSRELHNPNPTSVEMGKGLTLQPVSRTGYRFDGWFDADQGGSQVTAISEGNQEDVTLYARWTANGYTVVFDPNGGTGKPDPIEAVYDASVSIPNGDMLTNGRLVFRNWNTEQDGTGTAYEPGTTVVNLAESGTVTLYAQWDPWEITLLLYGNGGSPETVQVPLICQDKVTLPENTFFTRDGFRFAGWSSEPEEGSLVYAPGLDDVTAQIQPNGIGVFYARWKSEAYTVSFDPNGGESSLKDLTARYEASLTLPKSGVTRTGYRFTGWNTEPEGSGQDYAPGQRVSHLTEEESVTLYAQWTPITYTVRFNANKGAGRMTERKGIVYDESTPVPENEFTRKGYVFAGWNTKANGTGDRVEELLNLTAANNGSVTLYAQWDPTTYTVVFHGENEADVAEQELTYDTAEALNPNEFTKPGYTFSGWNTQKDGKGKSYKDGAKVTNLGGGLENTDLYAQWTANKYTVIFHSNLEKDSTKKQTLTYDGKETALTANGFSWKGYTFLGWATSADSGEVVYGNKEPVHNLTEELNIDLYAVWKANEYTVVFDPNFADAEKVTKSMTYDTADLLYTDLFDRDGYDFTGWATTARGKAVYKDGAEVKNLTDKDGAEVRLYAVWAPHSYTVTFDKNSDAATGSMRDQKMTVGKATALTGVGFKRANYTFVGWRTEPEGTVDEIDYVNREKPEKDLTTEKDGTVTLYAVWMPTPYAIAYQGLTTMEKDALDMPTYDVETTKAPADPVRPGFTFGGWYLDAKLTREFKGFDGFTGTLKLYPKWEGAAVKYAVSYAPGTADTTGTMAKQTGLVSGKEYAPKSCSFKRPGYLFAGWMLPDGETVITTKQKFSNLSADGEEDVVLTAVWTPITYKVRFNANKGTGKMADQLGFRYDEPQALDANTFTRKGYTFTGWNTKANGSGVSYVDLDTVEKLTTSNNGTVTLYAQWNANTYTVHFDANGGEGTMASLKMTYDQSQKLPANAYTNGTLKFQGWATAKDSTKVSYKNSASVKNLAETGEITLYAVWKK